MDDGPGLLQAMAQLIGPEIIVLDDQNASVQEGTDRHGGTSSNFLARRDARELRVRPPLGTIIPDHMINMG
ncbi:hypothetical protein MEX01_44460 [Methylorubrum extorquens]|nr:hypothetical protein MEX01_44460 [Methylorubrum extorquens]